MRDGLARSGRPEVRIAGGTLRGRRLQVGRARDLRPTSERAREGLFDWLGERVSGCTVLDLYAGTGALGIEALSRGAERAVFVERSRRALEALRLNCRELGLEAVTRIVPGSASAALTRLARSGESFDLVLADPPYGGDDWARLAKGANLVDLLAPAALLLLERATRDEPWDGAPGLIRRDQRRYGETAFDWYDRTSQEEGRAE